MARPVGELTEQEVRGAMQEADRLAKARPDVNLVYLGRRTVDGKETDEPAVVFVVAEKMSAQALAAVGRMPLPEAINASAERSIATDVVEGEPQRLAVLPLDEANQQAFGSAVSNQQRFDYPIPGGAQISPEGARWVGTLGCAVGWSKRRAELGWMGHAIPEIVDGHVRWGAITNRHVACGEKYGMGHSIGQPTGQDGEIGVLNYSPAIVFGTGNNYLDCAFIHAEDQGLSRIAPESIGVGPLGGRQGEPREPKIGDAVVKSGRTTGVTRGRVVGLQARTTVDYGEGLSARFVDQVIVQGDSGDFSQPGDSGSIILFADDLTPAGLLFAGGGGRTTANRIAYLVAAGFVFYGRRV